MALTYVKAENSDWLLSKHKQLLFVTADLLYLTLLIFYMRTMNINFRLFIRLFIHRARGRLIVYF